MFLGSWSILTFCVRARYMCTVIGSSEQCLSEADRRLSFCSRWLQIQGREIAKYFRPKNSWNFTTLCRTKLIYNVMIRIKRLNLFTSPLFLLGPIHAQLFPPTPICPYSVAVLAYKVWGTVPSVRRHGGRNSYSVSLRQTSPQAETKC